MVLEIISYLINTQYIYILIFQFFNFPGHRLLMSCLKRKGRTPNEFLLYTYLIYYLLVKNLDIHEVGIFIIQVLYIIQQEINK